MLSYIHIPCDDLNDAIGYFTERLGFRVDMVAPADDPDTAVISGHGVSIRLGKAESSVPVGDSASAKFKRSVGSDVKPIISAADAARWVAGRAGMEYRDLISGRLGGRLAASHIRLGAGGEVADYVHYHKIGFQMIYCWRGEVKVVYEGQGDEFWLHPGDCVLQPPEIRHRVLESSVGAEVIELASPASHETWSDHVLELPTEVVRPGRNFGGQRFIRHLGSESTPIFGQYGDFEIHDFGILAASDNAARVFELKTGKDKAKADVAPRLNAAAFYFVLDGNLELTGSDKLEYALTTGDSVTLPKSTAHSLSSSANSRLLAVIM